MNDMTYQAPPEHVLIRVEDLTMAYRSRPVLWDIDLDILRGSRTAIVGPNGAGKTTLIKGILELEKPLAGHILIDGEPFKKARRRIAYIPQAGSVNWDFPTTVEDVVLMGSYPRVGWVRRPRRSDKEAARRALEEMEMTEFADRQISQLSGGQRQRVFLARAICQQADIYIMDEPLTGVDVRTEAIIMDKIRQFQAEGKTTIAVHHDVASVPEHFDHVVLLNRQVIAAGPVEEALTPENLARAYKAPVSV